MTTTLPLFPLQLVVYPGEKLNLHVFEPRYKQLIQECQKQGTTFGIPAFIGNEIMPIGTEIELLEVEKVFANGEMDIKTRGIGIFEIDKLMKKMPDKLYSGAEISRLEIDFTTDIILAQKVLENMTALYQVMDINKEIPHSPDFLKIYEIAHTIGCNTRQEYEILTRLEETERLQYVLNHLETLIPIVKEMEMLRKKVQMNGHFKNILPPDIKEIGK